MITVAFLHTADVHVARFSRLLSEVAPGAIDVHLVDADLLSDARELFEIGDHAGYLDHVARHVQSLADDVDVVVLAQASMAPAADLLADLSIPVLSSPRLAVSRAVELADACSPHLSRRATGSRKPTASTPGGSAGLGAAVEQVKDH